MFSNTQTNDQENVTYLCSLQHSHILCYLWVQFPASSIKNRFFNLLLKILVYGLPISLCCVW